MKIKFQMLTIALTPQTIKERSTLTLFFCIFHFKKVYLNFFGFLAKNHFYPKSNRASCLTHLYLFKLYKVRESSRNPKLFLCKRILVTIRDF